MTKSQIKAAALIAVWLILPVVIGLIFYDLFVGRTGSTSVFSIIFGWQWILLAGIVVYLLIKAWRVKSKRVGLAALAIFVGLLATFMPAYISKESGRYITGEGSPAGPKFNCLVWENPPDLDILNLENHLCTLMSMPSYAKAWIDQNPDHERNDSTGSYYATLWFDEIILASFAYLGLIFWISKDDKPHKKSQNHKMH